MRGYTPLRVTILLWQYIIFNVFVAQSFALFDEKKELRCIYKSYYY